MAFAYATAYKPFLISSKFAFAAGAIVKNLFSFSQA
jgi:hypothetical protein